MTNDINPRLNIPRLDLPSVKPAPDAADKRAAEPTPSGAPEAKAQNQPDPQELRRQLQEATEQINRQMANDKRNLSFSVDDVADKIVVTVKNSQSGEVVRQIPNETALKVAHNLANLKGLLQDEKI